MSPQQQITSCHCCQHCQQQVQALVPLSFLSVLLLPQMPGWPGASGQGSPVPLAAPCSNINIPPWAKLTPHLGPLPACLYFLLLLDACCSYMQTGQTVHHTPHATKIPKLKLGWRMHEVRSLPDTYVYVAILLAATHAKPAILCLCL